GVDGSLGPEGGAGPLARSLESMENYYAGFGETWERIALIKARGIAGDRELAYEFLRQHQPFIYPRSPTPDLLDEIAKIKRRIERDVVRTDAVERNVKLGRIGSDNKIGIAHVCTPVTDQSRMPSSACTQTYSIA